MKSMGGSVQKHRRADANLQYNATCHSRTSSTHFSVSPHFPLHEGMKDKSQSAKWLQVVLRRRTVMNGREPREHGGPYPHYERDRRRTRAGGFMFRLRISISARPLGQLCEKKGGVHLHRPGKTINRHGFMHVGLDGTFPEDENMHDSCKQHLAG